MQKFMGLRANGISACSARGGRLSAALIAVLAIGAMTASAASAKPKLLWLKEGGQRMTPGATTLQSGDFLLNTGQGTIECTSTEVREEPLFENGTTSISFVEPPAAVSCKGALSFSSSGFYPDFIDVFDLATLGASGKGTDEVSIRVPWPGYSECTYGRVGGGTATVKAKNSTSGPATSSVAKVKLHPDPLFPCPTDKTITMTGVISLSGLSSEVEAEVT